MMIVVTDVIWLSYIKWLSDIECLKSLTVDDDGL